jgi:hypothetical protein
MNTRIYSFLIYLSGAVFLFFGLAFLIAPEYFGSMVDMEFSKPNALIDIRATYGGMLLGIAVWFFYCGKTNRVSEGLFSSFLMVSGLLLGRITGTIISGSPNKVTVFFLISEVFISAILLIFIIKHRNNIKKKEA